jgi:flagellar protein FlaG
VKTEPIKLSAAPAVVDGSRPRSAGPSVPVTAPAAAASAVVDAALNRAPQGRNRAQDAAAEANQRLAEKGSELTIEFEDVMDRMVFRLVDAQTGEVVRQIPSEEVLAIARALADDQPAGVLLRTNA